MCWGWGCISILACPVVLHFRSRVPCCPTCFTSPPLCVSPRLPAPYQIVFFEYASGGSLARMVSEYGPLESQGVRRFTRHIVCGLAHLHHHRVMHRDVKGGNVLVDRGVAKLGDCGCSKPVRVVSLKAQAQV